MKPEDQGNSGKGTQGKAKNKTGPLNKSKSVPSGMGEGGQSGEGGSGKASAKGGRKSLKKGASTSDVKLNGNSTSLKSKLSHHKSAAGIGARLYQAGLIKKMENEAQNNAVSSLKPEYMKVVKHPAPFR